MKKPRGRCKARVKAGTEEEGGMTRIEGEEDEGRIEQEEVTSKEDDRGDERNTEEEEEEGEEGSGRRIAIREHYPRQTGKNRRAASMR